MVKLYFLIGGMALCLFALWALGRHDLIRLTRPRRAVTARVIGHRLHRSTGGPTYAPVYAFHAEGADHEVISQIHESRPWPDVGAEIALVYPEGRPDLAERPWPLVRLFAYVAVLAMLVIMAGRLSGLLQP